MNEKGSSLRAVTPQRAPGVSVPKARGSGPRPAGVGAAGTFSPPRGRERTARTQRPASPGFRGGTAQSGLPYSPASNSFSLVDSPEPPRTPSDSPGLLGPQPESRRKEGSCLLSHTTHPTPPPPQLLPGLRRPPALPVRPADCRKPGSRKGGHAVRARGAAPGTSRGGGGGAGEGAEGRGAEAGAEGRAEDSRGGDAQARGRGAAASVGADRGGDGGGEAGSRRARGGRGPG